MKTASYILILYPKSYQLSGIISVFFHSISKKTRSFRPFLSLIQVKPEKDHNSINDDDLIKGFLNGDDKNFERLVERNMDMIFNLCFNIMNDYDDALDCAQEVFIKVFKNIRGFRFRSSFSTWIYAIAVNTCRDSISSSYRKRRVSISEIGEIQDSAGDTPVSVQEKNEITDIIRQAISGLPEEERVLIILRDMENRSYEEISVITGLKTGTIKSRISRARHRLRTDLKGISI